MAVRARRPTVQTGAHLRGAVQPPEVPRHRGSQRALPRAGAELHEHGFLRKSYGNSLQRRGKVDLPMPPSSSERKLVFLIGAVQFINTLDFLMVMPLGPDFARAL